MCMRVTAGYLWVLCPLCDAEWNLETAKEQVNTLWSSQGAAQSPGSHLALAVRLPQGGKTLAHKETQVSVLKEELPPALTFPEALSYL